MRSAHRSERGIDAPSGERGAALVYALVFMVVVSLIAGALLTQSAVQFRAADAYRNRRESVFAADAGLEQAASTIGLIASGSASTLTCTDPLVCAVRPELRSQATRVGPLPLTLPLTAAAGQNRLVVVATGLVAPGAGLPLPVTAVTYGGRVMHRAAIRSATDTEHPNWNATVSTDLWYLLDAELPAAAGSYPIVVTPTIGASPTAVSASSWVGVLQDVGGVAYVPTSGGTSLTTSTGSISATITAEADDTLLVSAVAHGDQDVQPQFRCTSNDAITGTGAGTRLAYLNPHICVGFATSYAVRSAGAQTVTEAFHTSSIANAQVLVGFRSAASAPSAPPVFGALCVGSPIHIADVNGFTVDAVCTMTGIDQLTIVSTATRGATTLTGRALLVRRVDGRVDITQWTTRSQPT